MAESKQSKGESGKMKPEPDARRLTNADVMGNKYQDLSTVTSEYRVRVNVNQTGKAKRLYHGEPKSIGFSPSDSTLILYCILDGPIPPEELLNPDPDAPRRVPLYFRDKGRTCNFSIRDAIRGWGVEIPKGQIAKVPSVVADVEGYGPCIVLYLKQRVLGESEAAAEARRQKEKEAAEAKKAAEAQATADKRESAAAESPSEEN